MANMIFDGSGLTVTRTFTLPDASGTLALTTGSASIVTVGTITTGTWHGTKIGLLYGGTNADLSGTGGTSQVLKQASAGAAITVGQLAGTDITGLSIAQTPVPTTGQTVTVTATATGVPKMLFVKPAGTLAALTLAFDDGVSDGQIVNVLFFTAITALTVTGNVEDLSGSHAISAASVGSSFSLAWSATASKWEYFGYSGL